MKYFSLQLKVSLLMRVNSEHVAINGNWKISSPEELHSSRPSTPSPLGELSLSGNYLH